MASHLVSACLLGRACRYDGDSKPSPGVQAQVAAWRACGDEVVAVCPEELGGLGTPRPAAELRGGDGHAVLDGRATVRRVGDDGDVTVAFVRGAVLAAEAAPLAVSAVLKARSPSCGCGVTEIDGEKRLGDGVFAAVLLRRGGVVVTDEAG
jgi:uncharacterized protein YbbK (DUF523 family)